MENKAKLSTEAYKGVRDFYPEDMFIQNHIFTVMKEVCQSFGYSEYNASVLEPAELYRAKSGEEIVNDQTYTFTDRGDREVTLRPEMTPTVARMVSARRRELAFPLRWFSIPNLFRYEKPQRGRLREHFQLNVDLFGATTLDAEVEVISLASAIMRRFGLKDNQFEIRLNSRKILTYVLGDWLTLDEAGAHQISKLIDKKNKLSREDFEKSARDVIGDKAEKLLTLLNSENLVEFVSHLPESEQLTGYIQELQAVISKLEKIGIANVNFDQTLMRGFDYYTGTVFEIYDTNPDNRRSVFGGGRYDDLLTIFGEDKIPAIGFGAGDVIIRDILETYGLLPTYTAPAELYLCSMGPEVQEYVFDLATELRTDGLRVATDFGVKKIGDQIKSADKQKIPFVIVVGEDERKSETFKVKNLKTGEETTLAKDAVVDFVKHIR